MKLTRDNAKVAEFPVVALEDVPVSRLLLAGAGHPPTPPALNAMTPTSLYFNGSSCP
jgi:hypothetical protein